MKKTAIVGATPNPARYAFTAARMLADHQHPIVPLGIKEGRLAGKEILDIRKFPVVSDIDTITLYLGAKHQPPYYSYLLDMSPKRIIFNPGTENEEFAALARARGIEVDEACTLVMLHVGLY